MNIAVKIVGLNRLSGAASGRVERLIARLSGRGADARKPERPPHEPVSGNRLRRPQLAHDGDAQRTPAHTLFKDY